MPDRAFYCALIVATIIISILYVGSIRSFSICDYGSWVYDVRRMYRDLHELASDDILSTVAPQLLKDVNDLMRLASSCP